MQVGGKVANVGDNLTIIENEKRKSELASVHS